MADLNSLPRESTILIREKHPWRNSKGVWTKSYGMADGTGQLITRPAGDFDKYEAVRIPEVSLHHPVFDEDLP